MSPVILPIECVLVCVCVLRLARLAVMLVVVYAYAAEGLSDRNLALLDAVCHLVQVMSLPAVVGGDLNLGRVDLAGTSIGHHLVYTSQVLNTCVLSGSELDCVLVTPDLAHTVADAGVTDVGVYPHRLVWSHLQLG